MVLTPGSQMGARVTTTTNSANGSAGSSGGGRKGANSILEVSLNKRQDVTDPLSNLIFLNPRP